MTLQQLRTSLLVSIPISVFLWSLILRAETGLDILGLARHDARMIAQELDYDTSIGVLHHTFGDAYPKLKILSETGKVSSIRSHLWDHTCYRGGRCPAGVPKATDTRPVRERALRLRSFVSAYPNIKCYVSPALEHDVKNSVVVNKWFAILKEVVPQCKPVCSAFTGYCPPNVLIEKHGNTGTADIRSNDGNSLFDSNSWNFRVSGRVLSLGWIPEFNGRKTGETSFVPPLKRPSQDFAGRALVRQVVRIMRPPEPRPLLSILSSCTEVREPELFKTNAEAYTYGKDDGRGNKGLFISQRRYDRVTIESVNGASVGCLRFFGLFAGGGFRSYVGTCSKQTPVGLMDALGSEWMILRVPGKCWLANSIRRTGYYR